MCWPALKTAHSCTKKKKKKNGVVNIVTVCKNWQVFEGKPDGEGLDGL